VNVLPKHMGSNKYPGMRNYPVVGLYREGHIGNPNLLYPNGTHVYGTDGTPGVAYFDGFIAGLTRAAVEPPVPVPAPPPAPTPPTAPAPPPVATAPDPSDGGASTPVSPQSAAVSAFGMGPGCASGGPVSAWLALSAIASFVLRRRRRTKP
jgi:MYXO-CTERM domain-containing protein